MGSEACTIPLGVKALEYIHLVGLNVRVVIPPAADTEEIVSNT